MKLNDIKTIACLGGGLIGSSWATAFAKAGFTVHVYEPVDEARKMVPEKIKTNLSIFVNNGLMTKEAADAAVGRVTCYATVAEAVKDVQFIQECGPEKTEVKKDLIAQIDRANTSGHRVFLHLGAFHFRYGRRQPLRFPVFGRASF